MTETQTQFWPVAPPTRFPFAVTSACGVLAEYLDDPRVTDVFVVADGRVFVDSGDGAYPVMGLVLSRQSANELARSLIELGGRHLDDLTPVADVSLGSGLRVHAVLPPISPGPLISLRVGHPRPPQLDALRLEHKDQVLPGLLGAVKAKKTVLVTGATGSGKTTMVAALLACAPRTERLVVVEDVAELRIDHPHVVSLETRQAGIEGTGEVDLARLVREALRMRPDRLVVGECRGAEIADMLQAFLTGHSGGATTLHAGSLEAVPARLRALASRSGMSARHLQEYATEAIDLIVHLSRTSDGSRHVECGRFVSTSKGGLRVEAVEPSTL